MICTWPTCNSSAVDGKYCYQHGRVYGEKKEKPKPQPIAKRAEKMSREMAEYKKEVQIFLAKPENHYCHIKSPVCKGKAVTVNHKRRRGKNLRNQDDWEPSCAQCNTYIESNSAWAYENCHLIKVHTKTQTNETTT